MQICEDIIKNHSFDCKESGSCANIGLEVSTMSTAIAYDNSPQVLNQKKKGIIEMVKDVLAIHERYHGLFSASQAMLALDISRVRFYQIEDRLEKIRVPMMGNKEFYTGRGLIKYREEATDGRGPAKEK